MFRVIPRRRIDAVACQQTRDMNGAETVGQQFDRVNDSSIDAPSADVASATCVDVDAVLTENTSHLYRRRLASRTRCATRVGHGSRRRELRKETHRYIAV